MDRELKVVDGVDIILIYYIKINYYNRFYSIKIIGLVITI